MEISVDDMYKIENKGHDMGFLKKFMMENAGAAAVRRLIEKFGSVEGKKILVFAGLGNNGGDALVMARHLAGHNTDVTVVLLGTPDKIKTEECKWNWSILEKMKSVRLTIIDSDLLTDSAIWQLFPKVITIENDGPRDHDIIIDGILGTGITGKIREPYASAIIYTNSLKHNFPKLVEFIVAVDVPSGLDPQTGETANICTECDMTVTFHKMKQGIPKRKDLTGEVFVEKIGIPPEAEDGIL